MLKLFDLLSSIEQVVDPAEAKIHLASPAAREDPLDAYFAGTFDEFQAFQNKKNFERPFVVALIQLREPGRWLFAGVYRSHGVVSQSATKPYLRYNLTRCRASDALAGRVVVSFTRTGRASYLRAERWADSLVVDEIKRQRLDIPEFPGFTRVSLRFQELSTIVSRAPASWRAALSSVSGVYVIADRETGELYVGSAVGGDGIWGRWKAYAATGHGGNAELRARLRERGAGHARNFLFSILETADTSASEQDVLRRESHWKDALLTRDFGLNRN